MRVSKVDTSDLVGAFRQVHNQLSTRVDKSVDNSKKRSSKPKKDPYAKFKEKLNDLQNTIDTFNSPELWFYFIEVAERNNIHYVCSNKARDLGALKILLSKYPAREICLMIEFLFESGQQYLELETITPSVIGSAWLNTIHSDSMKWVMGDFNPNKKAPKASREWSKSVDEDNIDIGGWD